MKKIYKPVSQAVIALGILLLTATSCGSDDKKETPNENLQGLWRITEQNLITTNTESSEATEGTETNEATEVDLFFPDSEGVQPYIRFNTTTYERFEVNPTDTLETETGSYTLTNNEITTLTSGSSAKIFGYTISGKQLVMIEKDGDLETSTFAEKVTDDPFLPEGPDDNEDPDNPDDEAPTGCALYHDANALEGSSLNPYLMTAGEPIDGTLLDVEGRNGYEARYYMQVEPYTAFRIHVQAINTTYADVIAQFQYTTISVNDAYSTDQFLFNTDIEKDAVIPIHFDLFASSSCLYIEFFSYQKEVTFVFEVEDLSAEQE
jgi:hypothetical protein